MLGHFLDAEVGFGRFDFPQLSVIRDYPSDREE
jgi:hypothetical protein